MAPSPNELLGLGKKLDLTDAATAKFYIVSFQRDNVILVIGVNLPFDGMYILDGGKIQVLAPYEGTQTL